MRKKDTPQISDLLCSCNVKNTGLLEKVLANLHEPATIINEKCIIQYANQLFLSLFSITGENFREADVCDFIIKRDRRKLLNILNKPDEKLKDSYSINLLGINRDNSQLSLQMKVAPLISSQYRLFIVTIIDRSDELKIKEKVEHMKHLASLGTFTSGVVHEFNNLLTGIKGYCQLANYSPTNPQLAEKAFSIIESECRRGSELCKNMSFYSSRTKLNIESVSLELIIDTAISLQNKFFVQENIKIHREIQGIPPLAADKYQIQQVMLNLIINARHAILPKGKGNIRIRLKESGKHVIIEIEDDGIGIDTESISRIFDPFFTSKEPSGINLSGLEMKGSGLGLAVSNSIIKKHRGTITVKSQVGKGSLFSIKLPKIYGEKAIDRKKENALVPDCSFNRSFKILVVDDEMSIRELLFRALTATAMEVTLARNADEAVTLCKSESYDVVILDYMLPEMNADSLVPVLKEHQPEARIVIISGWYSSPNQKKNIEKEIHAWIDKPFDVGQIYNCIKDIENEGTVKH